MLTLSSRNIDPSQASACNETHIRPLFNADVVTVEAVPALMDDQLFAEELDCVRSAVPKRRAEFGTARVCARRALGVLGIDAMPLVPQPDRSPSWPAGVVGSITHTKGYCAVVIARASALRSVGVDAEDDRLLEPGIATMICTPNERQQMLRRPQGQRDAIVYFAAKEAFYKCQYPLTRTFLDFQDVELEFDWTAGTFHARVIRGLAAKHASVHQLDGRFTRRDHMVLCGVELRVNPNASTP